MPYVWVVVLVVILALLVLALAIKVVKQYEHGVLFRLGRVIGGQARRIAHPVGPYRDRATGWCSLRRRASSSWSSRMMMRQAASSGVPWSHSSRARDARRSW